MIRIASVLIILLLTSSCKERNQRTVTDADMARAQQQLINENRKQHNDEMKNIKSFIADAKWPMQETGTGLHYWIYEPAQGAQAQKDQHVLITYKISLLDGTLCYEATPAEPKDVFIGHDNVETGLHEALQLMHEGEKAKFIFPSHLAFGFTGDSGKIPQNASVIYDIHLLKILP
jgi:FKBP-type peptidyl-prolyl cis-trans isomerase FkpA